MHFSKLAALLVVIIGLQGCVAAAVVTAVGGISAANDRRSIGHQIDDQTIEFNAYAALKNQAELTDHTNIQVISMNGTVLLIGQVTSSPLRALAEKTVGDVAGVLKLHNQLTIGTPTSLLTRTNDVWLTTKVKTALLGSNKLDATNVKVVTENGEVFLMGIVGANEADSAVNIARNIKGVNRVYNAFEISNMLK